MSEEHRDATIRASRAADRVARFHQRRRMKGDHRMTIWLDKDAMEALRVLGERYEPLSATRIIGQLIKLAAATS